MVLASKSEKNLRVTINKHVNRDSARKTLERIFLRDKAVARPVAARSANFKELPKRRGGVIWTKRPNKVHLPLRQGDAATVKATPQTIRDLQSVAAFVKVDPAEGA